MAARHRKRKAGITTGDRRAVSRERNKKIARAYWETWGRLRHAYKRGTPVFEEALRIALLARGVK